MAPTATASLPNVIRVVARSETPQPSQAVGDAPKVDKVEGGGSDGDKPVGMEVFWASVLGSIPALAWTVRVFLTQTPLIRYTLPVIKDKIAHARKHEVKIVPFRTHAMHEAERAGRAAYWTLGDLVNETNAHFDGRRKGTVAAPGGASAEKAEGAESIAGITLRNVMHLGFFSAFWLRKYADAGLSGAKQAGMAASVIGGLSSTAGTKIAFTNWYNVWFRKGSSDFTKIRPAVRTLWQAVLSIDGVEHPERVEHQKIQELVAALPDEKIHEFYGTFLDKLRESDKLDADHVKVAEILKCHGLDRGKLYDLQDKRDADSLKVKRTAVENLLLGARVDPRMKWLSLGVVLLQATNLAGLLSSDLRKTNKPFFEKVAQAIRIYFAIITFFRPRYDPAMQEKWVGRDDVDKLLEKWRSRFEGFTNRPPAAASVSGPTDTE